jgi:hypothetical protein
LQLVAQVDGQGLGRLDRHEVVGRHRWSSVAARRVGAYQHAAREEEEPDGTERQTDGPKERQNCTHGTIPASQSPGITVPAPSYGIFKGKKSACTSGVTAYGIRASRRWRNSGNAPAFGLDKIRPHSRHRSIATLTLYVDEHDRQRTQTTLADLVASTLTS